MPEYVKNMVVVDGDDAESVASGVDFMFSAVNMPKDQIRAIEERYAKTETPVVSNNSAHRWTPDVPMVVPEINPEHFEVIEHQRKRLGTTRGFIAVKPNCSIQAYTPALAAWKEFEPREVVVSTYQAISGAGKTFKDWPEMVGNIIPFISGEEAKSEKEPLKVFGHVDAAKGMVAWAKANAMDFVMVAPDDPLALGMVDALEAAGIPAFGPRANAAILEASKAFSKELMKKYHIPTAQYETFTDMEQALSFIHI